MSLFRKISDIFWGEWGSTKRRSECWLRVGQQVVCVAKLAPGEAWVTPSGKMDANPPKDGSIYTIAEVRPGISSQGFFLALVEKPGPQAYNSIHFRPVRETSIEVFRSLLSPTPEDVRRLREVEPA